VFILKSISFGAGVAEGRAAMRDLLGARARACKRWRRSSCQCRPGFTITTRVCTYFYTHGGKYPAGLKEGVAKSVARIEKAMGRRFGDPHNPLLVSVRSGARVSMPGMMDTVLNLGLTDEDRPRASKRRARTRASHGTPTGRFTRCTATSY